MSLTSLSLTLLLTFHKFHKLFWCSIVDFEQVNIAWKIEKKGTGKQSLNSQINKFERRLKREVFGDCLGKKCGRLPTTNTVKFKRALLAITKNNTCNIFPR